MRSVLSLSFVWIRSSHFRDEFSNPIYIAFFRGFPFCYCLYIEPACPVCDDEPVSRVCDQRGNIYSSECELNRLSCLFPADPLDVRSLTRLCSYLFFSFESHASRIPAHTHARMRTCTYTYTYTRSHTYSYMHIHTRMAACIEKARGHGTGTNTHTHCILAGCFRSSYSSFDFSDVVNISVHDKIFMHFHPEIISVTYQHGCTGTHSYFVINDLYLGSSCQVYTAFAYF